MLILSWTGALSSCAFARIDLDVGPLSCFGNTNENS